MPDNEDRGLLRDCLVGGPGAWEAFVRRFAPLLAEVCRRTLARTGRPCGPQEVDDMLQEVFAHLLERDGETIRAYRGLSGPGAYLSAVAVRRVLRDRTLRGPALDGFSPPSAAPGPAEILEAQEALGLLARGLAGLPAPYRIALGLQAEGASRREIAGALGLSEAAVANLLARARAALRQNLEKG